MMKQQPILPARKQQRSRTISRRSLSSTSSLLLLVWTCWSAAPSATTLACPCQGQVTIQSSIANSQTAVFATILDKLAPPTDPSAPQYYRADADGVIKGCRLVRDTTFFIKTAATSAQCGVDNLQPGVRYILFGTVSNEVTTGQTVLTIDSCQAQSVLASLDRATQTFLYNQPTALCSDNAGQPPVAAPVVASVPVRTTSNNFVNCQTCPNGFYDGCNTCGCANGLATFCSRNTCASYARASCTSNNFIPAPVPAPVIPVVVPRPVPQPVISQPIAQPVFSFNPWPPLPPTNFNNGPSPVAPRPNPPVLAVPRPSPVATTTTNLRPGTVSCASCGTSSFYDGCNTCTCHANGRRTCGRRVCASYSPAVCGGVSQPVPPPPPVPAPTLPVPAVPAINCQSCPKGFNDGCNTCGCSITGIPFCTNNVNCLVRRPLQCN